MAGGACLQRRRRRRAHAPAGVRGARHRLGGDAQHQHGDARGFGGDRQPPARGQIQPGLRAPQLDHRRAHIGAAHHVQPRAQHRLRIGQHAQDQARGIEPDLAQPRRVQPAAALFGRGGAEPDDRPAQFAAEHRGEAGGAARIASIRRIDLVQAAPRETAAQHPVEVRMIEARMARARGWAALLYPR
ncbi:hypothetical protein D1610_10840 [Sphingomonas gilva]|uniref:Uncharacterized protein n=1 Tax=Sphingomonas gilva TaxID=2305907 RepID=A0A396RM69_9SPHN|nr:hypothetical protein D1610_10840 [Sphingomonas gilva]